MKLETFSALAASYYDAALDPSRWPSLAADTASSFGVESCLMQIQNRAAGAATLVGFTSNFTARAMTDYRDYFFAADPWATAVIGIGVGDAVILSDLLPDAELAGTEFYQDWLTPHDIHDCLGGTVRLETGGVGIVGVQRARRMTPFADRDRPLMRMVLSHYAAAIDLTHRLAALRRGQSLAFDAMDSLSAALLIVDRTGRIVVANRTAEALLQKGDSLILRNGRLAARNGGAEQRLHKAIESAVLAARGRVSAPPGLVMLPRAEGNPLSLMVCPLPPEAMGTGSSEPMAMIFLSDPDGAADRWPEALARAYRLTPAEARLAGALLRGEHLRDYAEQAGITINTARSQLRSVLSKTDCARQSDFIRQVFSDPVLRMLARSPG
jgi:DNA-binding CsgD family transcriptional regulator/PAS domain-containing protein